MTTDRTADGALSPEFEAIAAASHDRVHAQAGEDPSAIEQAARRVAEAASAAIVAKCKRDADHEYEQAISRAGRLGLSHREIAAAAQVSHGTIRAILTRASTMTDNAPPRSSRRRANPTSSPHSRRASSTSHRHTGARPGTGRPQRPAQLLCTPVFVLRQPLGQVKAIRPGAGQVDDAAAPASRLQIGRDPHRGFPPGAVTVKHHRHEATGK